MVVRPPTVKEPMVVRPPLFDTRSDSSSDTFGDGSQGWSSSFGGSSRVESGSRGSSPSWSRSNSPSMPAGLVNWGNVERKRAAKYGDRYHANKVDPIQQSELLAWHPSPSGARSARLTKRARRPCAYLALRALRAAPLIRLSGWPLLRNRLPTVPSESGGPCDSQCPLAKPNDM